MELFGWLVSLVGFGRNCSSRLSRDVALFRLRALIIAVATQTLLTQKS